MVSTVGWGPQQSQEQLAPSKRPFVVSICWVRQRMLIDMHTIRAWSKAATEYCLSSSLQLRRHRWGSFTWPWRLLHVDAGLRFYQCHVDLSAISSSFIRLKILEISLALLLAHVHHSSHDSEGLGLTLLHPLCVVSIITGGIKRPSKPVPQSCPYKYITRRSRPFLYALARRRQTGRHTSGAPCLCFPLHPHGRPGSSDRSELYIFSSCRINIMLS
jgi:hypothetical protein